MTWNWTRFAEWNSVTFLIPRGAHIKAEWYISAALNAKVCLIRTRMPILPEYISNLVTVIQNPINVIVTKRFYLFALLGDNLLILTLRKNCSWNAIVIEKHCWWSIFWYQNSTSWNRLSNVDPLKFLKKFNLFNSINRPFLSFGLITAANFWHSNWFLSN